MNYLVTGGAGFIGSNLVNRLLKSKYNNVTVIDNFSTGRLKNILGVKYQNFDIVDPLWINRYATETIARMHGLDKPDVIFNLACPASPKAYQLNPIHTTMTSVMGMYHALLLAERYKARILQNSTSEVYGDPMVHPQRENYWGNVNSFGPRSCYDEGKRTAESLCYDFHHKLGVDIRIARIFNTYGPGMAIDDGRVVSNFIVQALRNEPITIYGDGQQTRSFCYVDDMVDGLLALNSFDIHEPVNLGNPGEFTMLELAELILKITKSNSKLVFKKLPVDDPKQRKPDIFKAENYLDWEPIVSLEQGLEKTIHYFRKEIFDV